MALVVSLMSGSVFDAEFVTPLYGSCYFIAQFMPNLQCFSLTC